jgi:hypothetical protein
MAKASGQISVHVQYVRRTRFLRSRGACSAYNSICTVGTTLNKGKGPKISLTIAKSINAVRIKCWKL